ncbi:MAG: protein kinase domain-containing protein [Isosphaeraceae bacterium]
MDELNRDVLVAVLALLTDAIPRHALSVALGIWARDRRRSLAEVLLADGAVDRDRLAALVCLADAQLARPRDDLQASLEAWNVQARTEEVLTEIHDAALRTTLGAALRLEPTLPATDAAAPDNDETFPHPGPAGNGTAGPQAVATGPRFRPIRPHARGGIGQVWVARDGELQREVALKVIQDRYAARADQRARFVLEAEITGNLEHPGIVPVYSLGHDPDGRPYYAMRFIRGESLSAALRRFHGLTDPVAAEAPGRSETPDVAGMEFRELLGRFLDVCDAIDYAHSRGVLHRDLKPANIMLGKYGETLVVDWGLAKVIGRPDIVPTIGEGDGEPTLAASGTGSHAGDTAPGTTVGTPAYMSPEQASGDLDGMGLRSDVYSLGATFYELLTGQLAFRADDARAVLAKVVAGDFRPPRAVLPSVPLALEAVCLKAMALEPAQRYESVRDLARDIRNWLADEPVAAHVEGRVERLGRWLRRHRTWTAAAAAALVVLTLGATGGMIVVENGRRREAEARALAETNYNLARRAVDDYLTRVSEDTLLKSQDSVDLRRLRSELLKTALDYYRAFLEQRRGDPELRREVAEAQYRVGQIMREIGTPGEAVPAFEASIALWGELQAARPADADVRAHLARATMALGEQLTRLPDFPRAFETLAHARDMMQGLVDDRPNDATARLALAECDKELGIAEGEGGEPDRALGRLREAESILRELPAGAAADPANRKRLGDVLNARGFIHARIGQLDDSLRAFREFQALCQSLLDQHRDGPPPADLLNRMGLSYYNISTILYRLHSEDHRPALEMLEKALVYRDALVVAHPSVNDFRENLAGNLSEIAPLRHEVGRDDDALAAIRRSIEIHEALVNSHPEQARYHAELGRALHILGFLRDEWRDNVQGLAALSRARDEEDRAVADAPESDLYRGHLAEILWNLGEQYLDLGRVEEALPHYRRAVVLRRELLGERPGDRTRKLELADQLAMLAAVERSAGDPAASRRWYAEAAALVAGLDVASVGSQAQVLRAGYLLGEARSAADQEQDGPAANLLGQARGILDPMVAAARASDPARRRLSEVLWEQARLARRAGQAGEAARLDAHRRELWTGRPPAELVRLTFDEISSAARVGYGRTPLDTPADSARRRELDLAADHLRLAVAFGLTDVSTLRNNRDFGLVLGRPDLPAILYDAGFPNDPMPEDAGSR